MLRAFEKREKDFLQDYQIPLDQDIQRELTGFKNWANVREGVKTIKQKLREAKEARALLEYLMSIDYDGTLMPEKLYKILLDRINTDLNNQALYFSIEPTKKSKDMTADDILDIEADLAPSPDTIAKVADNLFDEIARNIIKKKMDKGDPTALLQIINTALRALNTALKDTIDIRQSLDPEGILNVTKKQVNRFAKKIFSKPSFYSVTSLENEKRFYCLRKQEQQARKIRDIYITLGNDLMKKNSTNIDKNTSTTFKTLSEEKL